MKSSVSLLLVVLLFTNFATAQYQNMDSKPPIEIDVTKSIKNPIDFNLSDFISNVKLIKLHSEGKILLGDQPDVLYFGESYILMRSEKRNKIGLYDKKGEIISVIGNIGKGPAEHANLVTGTIDPTEKFILLYDEMGQKLILFDIEGNFIREKKVDAPRSFSINSTITFISTDTFGLMIPRPSSPTSDYASIRIFNLELEPVANALRRANDNLLVRYNFIRNEFFRSDNGVAFWETFNDTIFRIEEDGSTRPLYNFSIKKDKVKLKMLQDPHLYDRDPTAISNYVGIHKVYITNTYVIAMVTGIFNGFIFHNINTGDTFSTSVKPECLNSSATVRRNSFIRNDIYGFESINFEYYSSTQNVFVGFFPAFYSSMFFNLSCMRERNVKQPEIRNKLLSIIDQKVYDDEVVLVVHFVK